MINFILHNLLHPVEATVLHPNYNPYQGNNGNISLYFLALMLGFLIFVFILMIAAKIIIRIINSYGGEQKKNINEFGESKLYLIFRSIEIPFIFSLFLILYFAVAFKFFANILLPNDPIISVLIFIFSYIVFLAGILLPGILMGIRFGFPWGIMSSVSAILWFFLFTLFIFLFYIFSGMPPYNAIK